MLRRLSFSLLLLLLTGCMSRSPHDPFSISRATIQNSARMIALAPVADPSGIQVAESLLVQIDALIEEMLLGAGYHCVPRQEYVATWDHIVAQMGGLYESETEEIDELKLEVAREQLRRDLMEIHQSDFVLYPEIWIVDAAHSGGVANWDGASQSLVGFGTRVLNVIEAYLSQDGGFLQPGLVNALSLGITVENMDGVEIFQNAGGIEVLKDADRQNGNAEAVLYKTVLADPKRNHEAVRTALLPLVEGRYSNPPRR
jgi:hypothetical protein